MIKLKTEKEIEIMKGNAQALSQIMKKLEKEVKPGVKAEALDKLAEELILNYGAKPSFKGYRGFPASLCVSINEEVVHGVPDKKVLKEGNLVSLDLGLFKNGFHADMSRTFPVGEVGEKEKKLMEVTWKALEIGIGNFKVGNKLGDVSSAIGGFVEKEKFGVVKTLCGHGIGENLHEDPEILNYGQKGTGVEIEEGMVVCLEPMVTLGSWRVEQKNEAFVTVDGSLSAHFEDMIAATQKGPRVLTRL